MDPKNLVVGAKLWVCKRHAMRPKQVIIAFIHDSPRGPDDFRIVGYQEFGGKRDGLAGLAIESEEVFDSELDANRVAVSNARASIERCQRAAAEAAKRIEHLAG